MSDDDMNLAPVNEWLAAELARMTEELSASERNLQDLIERHEGVVNNYARVCQQNDKMRQAGDALRDLLIEHEITTDVRVTEALQKWGDANV